MASPDQLRLVEVLAEKTSRGELDWKMTADETIFLVSLKKNTVRLSSDPESAKYTIEVLNGEGIVVDEFDQMNLEGVKFGPCATCTKPHEGMRWVRTKYFEKS
jgi:hypothetical protein